MLNPFLPARPKAPAQPQLSQREEAIHQFYASGLAGLLPFERRRVVLAQLAGLPN